MGDKDAALSEKILDISEAQREAQVQPDGMLDDHWWEPIAVVAERFHCQTLPTVKRPDDGSPLDVTSPPRGSYQRQGDDELLQAIRQLTDARSTYGYRRITALLNRARRASGADPVNHKRIFRLMRQAQLLLQPFVGLRPVRAHRHPN